MTVNSAAVAATACVPSPDDTEPRKAAPEKLAYNVREVATKLGVSEPLVWKLLAAGRIRATKLGRRTLIRAEELQRVLEQGA